jgi:hypothetical protein
VTRPATRERWAAEIEVRAHAYWTPERLAQLFGDKRPAISPREGAVLLRALGLLRADASLPPAKVRKYFQIKHVVALLGPALRELRAQVRRRTDLAGLGDSVRFEVGEVAAISPLETLAEHRPCPAGHDASPRTNRPMAMEIETLRS